MNFIFILYFLCVQVQNIICTEVAIQPIQSLMSQVKPEIDSEVNNLLAAANKLISYGGSPKYNPKTEVQELPAPLQEFAKLVRSIDKALDTFFSILKGTASYTGSEISISSSGISPYLTLYPSLTKDINLLINTIDLLIKLIQNEVIPADQAQIGSRTVVLSSKTTNQILECLQNFYLYANSFSNGLEKAANQSMNAAPNSVVVQQLGQQVIKIAQEIQLAGNAVSQLHGQFVNDVRPIGDGKNQINLWGAINSFNNILPQYVKIFYKVKDIVKSLYNLTRLLSIL